MGELATTVPTKHAGGRIPNGEYDIATSGTIYHDTSSKGIRNGKQYFKNVWRAEITINGQRHRHRGKTREDCEKWLKDVKEGKYQFPENEKSLFELPDYPGYFIDAEKKEAWSFVRRGACGKPKWHKLRVFERDHGLWTRVRKDKNFTMISVSKVAWFLNRGLPYNSTPLEIYCFLADGSLKERSELIRKGWERRKDRIKKERAADVRHTIRVLGYLERAYKGDGLPILNYVHGSKREFIYRLKHASSFSLHGGRAELGFQLAYDKLLENITEGNNRIYDFDRWFLGTAYALVMKAYDEKSKYVNIEKLRNLV